MLFFSFSLIVSVVMANGIQISDNSPGLIGFTCSGPRSNVTSISTRNVIPCERSSKRYQFKSENIQIIKVSRILPVSYMSCFVKLTYDIYRCGMFSHMSFLSSHTFLAMTSKEECHNMVKKNTYKIEGIQINGIQTSKLLEGNVNPYGSRNEQTGYCEGASFVFNNIKRDSAVMSVKFSIVVETGDAEWDTETDTVLYPTGQRCKRGADDCLDITKGYLYSYDRLYRECSTDDITILYKGPSNTTRITPNLKSYLISNDDKTFALDSIEKKTLCSHTVFYTGLQGLFIVPELNGTNLFDNSFKKDMFNMNHNSFVSSLSKIILVERNTEYNFHELSRDIEYKMCELRYNNYNSMISLAKDHPRSFALMMGKGPGYLTDVRGEIAYIIKCDPVVVKPRETPGTCWDGLPVWYNDEEYFIQSNDHILVRKEKQVDCDNLFPTAHQIDGQWISFTPVKTIIPPPQQLNPNRKNDWDYMPLQTLVSSGIYNHEDFNNIEQKLFMTKTEQVATNFLTRQMIGLDANSQNFRTFVSMDSDEVVKTQNWIGSNFWYYFDKFSHIVSGIIGIVFVYKIIKSIINVFTSAILIIKTPGLTPYQYPMMMYSAGRDYIHSRRTNELEKRLNAYERGDHVDFSDLQ